MNRRNFLKSSIGATFALSPNAFGTPLYTGSSLDVVAQQVPVQFSASIDSKFQLLLSWLNETGWIAFLNRELGTKIDPKNTSLENYTNAIEVKRFSGFEDFKGNQLIRPGYPAGSLLYHALASPRVKPPTFEDAQFPTLMEIDALEDIIYSLYPVDGIVWKDVVLSVFAYEYRPALKTPHHAHADMVFSRAGIARIGKHEKNYDAINRCYTNRPKVAEQSKEIAIMPARYGLFLAQKVQGIKDISLMNSDGNDDLQNGFLKPFRKVFSGDPLINGEITFKEYHLNEKLAALHSKLPNRFDRSVDVTRPPFRIESDNLVRCVNVGSSALIESIPGDLVSEAMQDSKRVFLKVEANDAHYFSALSTIKVDDEETLDVEKGKVYRIKNPYDAPRNAPMFVNVKYKRNDPTTNEVTHLDKKLTSAYEAGLFIDNICDGYVIAEISESSGAQISETILRNCNPAFSIVTAPDFFPLVDANDLSGFDLANDQTATNFFEGGLHNLSATRHLPNQALKHNNTTESVFGSRTSIPETVTAVLSDVPQKGQSGPQLSHLRDYQSTSFLPDVCSGIFAPGWDVTYTKDSSLPGLKDVYITTKGLGSPFAEDMKLCGAMNGMWPASSPDTARSFQGLLEFGYRNPTAIPLMDTELGLHRDSPHCANYHVQSETGWDGEYGPFLKFSNDGTFINFSDLERVDYIHNVLQNRIDMSLLRERTAGDLLERMGCLKLCISGLPHTNFGQRRINNKKNKIVGLTGLWLVSAEKVLDWNEGARGYGIPNGLVSGSLAWATSNREFKSTIDASQRVTGSGFLYIFVSVAGKPVRQLDEPRAIQQCRDIYVCQVTEQRLVWTEIPSSGASNSDRLVWHAYS